MKIKRFGNNHYVRIEELLPCKNFSCRHELMSCAITTWCPDGCHDTNNYSDFCIPKCIDCVHYPHCTKWREFPDMEKHSAISEKHLPYFWRKINGILYESNGHKFLYQERVF